MKHPKCPKEDAVTRAALTGDWKTALKTHATSCPVCRGVMKTSSWMQILARSSERDCLLPDASLLWRRAQLSKKHAKTERSQNILEWIAFASIAVPSLGLTAWLAWNWYSIESWIAWILAGAQLSAAAYAVPSVFSSIIAILSLVAIALVFPIVGDE